MAWVGNEELSDAVGGSEVKAVTEPRVYAEDAQAE